ncbi:M15 family metallopeptidase [Methylobacterium sp. E-005]|uniref:M15 family metallopeptidase n=1 Tax=Methylobacterium sp. E-005 TaxID=2836549 RepID=UPI001FBA265F|nr:M15 family metallopeptidase [Methylobacterium sp. E-005]MCJ2087264.1 M15 family metallopeptidase [Methylobacterium sp. E-005]
MGVPITDAIAVTLGLDARQYFEEMVRVGRQRARVVASNRQDFERMKRETVKELKEIQREQDKHAKAVEAAHDKISNSFGSVIRSVLKLYAVFTAGKAVGDFVRDITQADAALGRLAKSLETTPEALSSLGAAVARSGGSADAAVGSFEKLANAYNEVKLTGRSATYDMLSRLSGASGKAIQFGRDTTKTILDAADAAKALSDRQGVSYTSTLLREAGLDPGTIALMVQGSAKVKEAFEKVQRLGGVVSKRDTEAAQRFSTALTDVTMISTGLGRTIWTQLSPAISEIIEKFVKWYEVNGEWLRTEISEKVKQLAEYLRSIDWNAIGTAIKDFAVGCNDAAKAVGGWKVVFEALLGAWLFTKLYGLLRVLGLIRLAMGASSGAGGIGRLLAFLATPAGAAAAAIIGTSAATDAAVPNAEKPGVITRSDDENTGAASGAGLGGVLRRGYRAARRMLGGGDADAAEGGGIRRRAARAAQADKANYNFTGDNANIVKQAAAELGTSPKDLATVISYETGGKFSPSIWGGKGGSMLGLIQFNRENQRKYGVNDKQSFSEQMPAVVKYLKDRGFKKGMNLNQLYATINGGNPYVSQNASDGNGTIAQHVERMRSGHAARVERFLNSGGPASPTSKPDGSPLPTDGTGVNADLMKVYQRAQQLSEVKFHIHEGLRSIERQKEMVARKWSHTMNSKHLTGRAIDIRADGDPAVGGLDAAKYGKINDAMKKASQELGVPIQWGGDSFGSFKDVPHFQLPDSYKSNAGAYGAAKTSALDAVKSGARAASENASLAQSLLTSNSVTNHGAQDNSTRTETQYNGDFHFHGVQDPKGMMAELKRASVGSRSFTAAADYGTA